jgi:hypothetical protein
MVGDDELTGLGTLAERGDGDREIDTGHLTDSGRTLAAALLARCRGEWHGARRRGNCRPHAIAAGRARAKHTLGR